MKFMKKLLVVGAFALASTSAFAAHPFTVDTAPAGGANIFVADKMSGIYTESIKFDSAFGNWEAKIILDVSTFSFDGVAISPGITQMFAGGDGQLYITLDVSGSTTFSATPGELFLSGITGVAKFWLDPGADTTFKSLSSLATSGGVNALAGVGTADVELASSTNLQGLGILNASSSSFAISGDSFTLTPTGELFFVAPRPFYVELNSSGDLTSNIIDPSIAGVFQYDGQTASVQFVSEPSSIAILGLGLLGAGFLSRRKS